MTRGLILWVVSLGSGCTIDNPAFGADGSGSDGGTTGKGDTTKGETTKSSDSQSTSVSSSDGSTTRSTSDVTGETLPGTTANPETSAEGSTTHGGDASQGDASTSLGPTSGVASETGSTTGLMACDIDLPGTCGACVLDWCCDALTFCFMDPGCEGLATCVGGDGSLADCLSEVGIKFPPDEYADLAGCMIENCPAKCSTAA